MNAVFYLAAAVLILLAYIAGRRIAPPPRVFLPRKPSRLPQIAAPPPPPPTPRLIYPSLGEALAESHRKIWDALRTSPESVAVVPADRIVTARARKNDRHGAWIKVSVPDEIVLALGTRPEGRKYEVFPVTVPGPAAMVSE